MKRFLVAFGALFLVYYLLTPTSSAETIDYSKPLKSSDYEPKPMDMVPPTPPSNKNLVKVNEKDRHVESTLVESKKIKDSSKHDKIVDVDKKKKDDDEKSKKDDKYEKEDEEDKHEKEEDEKEVTKDTKLNIKNDAKPVPEKVVKPQREM